MIGYVYKYTSPSNKVYVGITIDEHRRKYHHKFYSYKNDTKFRQAILKYGFDNFEYEILEQENFNNIEELKNKLKLFEIYYIEKYDSYKNGYNMSKGGDDSSFNVLSETEGKYGVGKIFKTKRNRTFEIIEKINYNERIIRFEDGYEVKVFIINIKKGSVLHPEDYINKIGRVYTMNDGGKVELLKRMNKKVIITLGETYLKEGFLSLTQEIDEEYEKELAEINKKYNNKKSDLKKLKSFIVKMNEQLQKLNNIYEIDEKLFNKLFKRNYSSYGVNEIDIDIEYPSLRNLDVEMIKNILFNKFEKIRKEEEIIKQNKEKEDKERAELKRLKDKYDIF